MRTHAYRHRRSSNALLLVLCLTLGGMGAARGQGAAGTVRFANDVDSGVGAPFYDLDGVTRLSGSGYLAALYAGPPDSPPESWLRVSDQRPFRTEAFAGFWTTTDVDLPILFPTGSAVGLQVRFWDSVNGTVPTFEAAQALGAAVGVSQPITVVLKEPPEPTSMSGLPSAGLVPTITLTRGAPGILTDPAAVASGIQFTQLCGLPVGTNRWFRITSPFPGEALVTTVGSSMDAVMGAFRGSIVSPSALTALTCNDDRVAGETASEVRFPVEANTLYLLCVAGKNGTGGTLRLNPTLTTQLQIRRLDVARIELSWPSDATNFVVEANLRLAGAAGWLALTNRPGLTPEHHTLTLDRITTQTGYRLHWKSEP